MKNKSKLIETKIGTRKTASYDRLQAALQAEEKWSKLEGIWKWWKQLEKIKKMFSINITSIQHCTEIHSSKEGQEENEGSED